MAAPALRQVSLPHRAKESETAIWQAWSQDALPIFAHNPCLPQSLDALEPVG